MVIVYRTPSCIVAKTEQHFKVLTDLSADEKHAVIVGDFNIPDFHHVHELVYCHDFTKNVTQPTRGCCMLDLDLSSFKDFIENLKVCSPLGMGGLIYVPLLNQVCPYMDIPESESHKCV